MTYFVYNILNSILSDRAIVRLVDNDLLANRSVDHILLLIDIRSYVKARLLPINNHLVERQASLMLSDICGVLLSVLLFDKQLLISPSFSFIAFMGSLIIRYSYILFKSLLSPAVIHTLRYDLSIGCSRDRPFLLTVIMTIIAVLLNLADFYV